MFLLLCLVFTFTSGLKSTQIQVNIDATEKIGNLNHFWESTGLCPPMPHQNASKYYLSEDMLQNIMMISSVPHNGMKQVRMHWLLDMVTFDESTSSYNFDKLDILLQRLRKYKLKPGFELMGSPSNIFTNFDDEAQVKEWQRFVTTLATRYVKMFGLEDVSQWNFETWNEPDHKDFDDVKMSVKGFLKYYDASSKGLGEVDKSLVFGGPGGSCRKESFSKRCWALMAHCTNGTNYITGKKGSRINYISIHKKGSGSSKYIIDTELETVEKIHWMYPALRNVPIYNDEGDPMVGWSKPYEWRGDVTYPAIVTKIIAQHLYKIINNKSSSIRYQLLSNDNGFLNYYPYYFTQRTLLARFQMNNTHPKHVHFVKKPIHGVMTLLSKLGNVQVKAAIESGTSDVVGVIASSGSSSEISVIAYASVDTLPSTDTYMLNFDIRNTNRNTTAVMMACTLNNELTNPYRVWKEIGKPDFPSSSDFQKMHQSAEPACSVPRKIDTSIGLTFNQEMLLPGVTLFQICWKQPSGVYKGPDIISVRNITSGQVLIVWDDIMIKTKCIKTYELEICHDKGCTVVKKLNSYTLISNSFVYISSDGDKGVIGWYRIRFVDFWDRYSPYSNIVLYMRYSQPNN